MTGPTGGFVIESGAIARLSSHAICGRTRLTHCSQPPFPQPCSVATVFPYVPTRDSRVHELFRGRRNSQCIQLWCFLPGSRMKVRCTREACVHCSRRHIQCCRYVLAQEDQLLDNFSKAKDIFGECVPYVDHTYL